MTDIKPDLTITTRTLPAEEHAERLRLVQLLQAVNRGVA